MHTQLRIGNVATAAGLTVDTVRYYERLGLLKPTARTEGGFRTYEPSAVERIAFIRQAQRLGLHLREIKALLAASAGSGTQHCQRVRGVLVTRLDDVETQMAELKAFRKTLRTALKNCDAALSAGAVSECPVVQSLTSKRNERSIRR